jgi:hypothetical protein
MLVFSVLMACGAVFAYLALKFRGYIMGIFAGAMIIFAAYYTRSVPIAGIEVGGGLDTGIYLSVLALGIMTSLLSLGKFIDGSDGRSIMQRAFGGGIESTRIVNFDGNKRSYKPDTSTMEGRAALYRMGIHSKLNQPRRGR